MRKLVLALALALSCGCATAEKVGGRVLFSGPIGGGGAGTPFTGALGTNALDLTEQAAPSLSAVGHAKIYAKTDHSVYLSTNGGAYAALSTGGGGGSTLAATLAAGNTTGGTPIIVSAGDYIAGAAGSNLSIIAQGDGYNATLQASDGITGNAGNANVTAGNGGGASGRGGSVQLNAGVPAGSGALGIVNVTGGASFVMSGAQLTTATNGFVYLATCPGTPTGVPVSRNGTANGAMVVDTTGHKLFVYDNSAWNGISLTGGGGGATINPTTSIITIGTGLGAVTQFVGPSDRTTWFSSGTSDAVNGNGQEFDIIAHNGGSTTGRGGLLYLSGGDAVAGNNFGGAGQLWGGNGKGSQHGGNLDTGGGNGGATGSGGNWSGGAGNGGGTSGDGGSWTGSAGNATASGFGGTVSLQAGGTASGTSGQIQLRVCPSNSTTRESALTIDGAATGSNGYLRVIPIADGGGFLTHLGDHDTGFGALYLDYTGTASVGNVTMQTPTGRVNVAAGATSVTVTNGLVKAKSKVFASVSTNDTTAFVQNVVPAAGSFTIRLGAAATAQTSIDFLVIGAD